MRRLILILAALIAVGCNSLVDAEEEGPGDCDIYCNIMMEGCDQVYSGDLEACYDACEEFPSQPQLDDNGDLMPLGERVDNADSIECRVYHGETALDLPPNNSHCAEAAPTGGGTCSDAPPPCAEFCSNMYTACADPEQRTTEDYFECERSCPDPMQLMSEEFACRLDRSRDARTAQDEGAETRRKASCALAASRTPCADTLPDL